MNQISGFPNSMARRRATLSQARGSLPRHLYRGYPSSPMSSLYGGGSFGGTYVVRMLSADSSTAGFQMPCWRESKGMRLPSNVKASRSARRAIPPEGAVSRSR
jgi:hypothetical protein